MKEEGEGEGAGRAWIMVVCTAMRSPERGRIGEGNETIASSLLSRKPEGGGRGPF
jgi:hypothetical protein